MKKVKIPAKINLTLDVLGTANGYHEISSIVCSVNVYDVVKARKRKDGIITLSEKGIPSECEKEKNNAHRAAVAFVKKYNTAGADVIVKKNIPVGGGLGGSSADIAGTLKAMQKLYRIKDDMTPLANSLGSDSGYMLKGGAAIIYGRGEKVKSLPPIPTLYLLFITAKEKCVSSQSYKNYDEIGITYKEATKLAANALKSGDLRGFCKLLKNDLTEGSAKILPQIKEGIKDLMSAGADAALMTGSGSCVYGVFIKKKDRNVAYKKLFGVYGKRLIKARTLN